MSSQVMTATATLARPDKALQRRVAAADWDCVAADLDAQGFAIVPGASQCEGLPVGVEPLPG